ncbi:MAG: putative colanic acid biosynthesis acetyltransferase [Prevotella sp.]|nr:putative colanic acid biosynthesis acetyltransferase [Prevotella sp.]
MQNNNLDIAHYKNALSKKNQIIRFIWGIVWPLGTWFLPKSVGAGWKRFLLRSFGARIHKTAMIYSSARIFYPKNLVMDEYSCLASDVNCYNVATIKIGAQTTVSQGAYLCTASHDISDPKNHLITAPITIESQAWIATEAFIGMGVTIGEGAVVGARAVVTKDVEPWVVVAGNPAKLIKERVIKNE